MGSVLSCNRKDRPEKESAVTGRPQQTGTLPTKSSKSGAKSAAKTSPKSSPQGPKAFISEEDVAAQKQSQEGQSQRAHPMTRQETISSTAPRRQVQLDVDADIPENFKL